MLHHSPPYIDTLDAERRRAALERMLCAASGGDGAAWSALFDRFANRVRRVALGHRLHEHEVEDVVQETYLRLLEHIDAIRDPRAVGSWLETTARRQSLAVLRSGRREYLSDDELLGDAPCPTSVEDTVADNQRRAALRRAIGRLPERQREVLRALSDDESGNYRAIARTIGVPVGSIGPTRARALTALSRDADLARAL